jgi:hypothetical protein
MMNEPGQAVVAILDNLIETIKSTRPLRSDNKPLETGFVYSQLVLGQMVDPDDFKNAWSPMGGTTVHDAVTSGAVPATAGAPATPGAAPAATPAPSSDVQIRRAIQAAFNTSQLVDRLIMVSKDEKMREYPGGGRTISFAYEGIINGMQSLPAPLIAPEIQKQIDDAQKVLYELDEDGNIAGKSKLYRNYVKNATAYAKAKKDFTDAQSAALRDPAKAESWPQDSVVLQQQVDQAYDDLKTEGAEKIERAIGIIESVGVSIQDRMIAKARKIYDAWNLGLAGVPVATPYSSISPSSWADPDQDIDGWYHLHVESSDYASHTAKNSHFFQDSSSHSDSSSTSGSVSASYFGFGGSGGGGTSSSHTSSSSDAGGGSSATFKNDAKGLTIDLEYGLIDIRRDWFMGDVFYMKNWYLVNCAKNAISDGTINGQADSDKTLLPMVPMQALVVRNVSIKATEWGSDGATMEQFFGESSNQSSTSASNVNAKAGFGLGPFSFGGSVSHSKSQSDSKSHSDSQSSSSQDYEAHFRDGELSIKGAQIVAWLSTILPACPPLDDPGLKKQSDQPAAAQPAAATPKAA